MLYARANTARTLCLVLAAALTVVTVRQASAQSPADFVSGTLSGAVIGGDPVLNTPLLTVPAGKTFVLTDLEYTLSFDPGQFGNRVEGDVTVYQGMQPRWSMVVFGKENSGGAVRDMVSKSFATGITFPSGSSASVIHRPWQDADGSLQVRWRLSWSGYMANNAMTGINDPAPTNELKLGNAAPNPLDDETRVGFMLGKESRITLRVVDVRGRVVRTLFQGRQPAGEHDLVWNARDDDGRAVRSGVYFIELLAEKERHSRKAVVIN